MSTKCYLLFVTWCILIALQSCDPNDDEMPEGRYGYTSPVNISIVFDSTQERLDNYASPSVIPQGHGSISPSSEFLHIKNIELLEDNSGLTSHPVNQQDVKVYGNEMTYYGSLHHGASAQIKYLRLYLFYQKYSIGCKVNGNYANCDFACFLSRNYNSNESIFVGDTELNTDTVINQGKWFLNLDHQALDTVIHSQTTTVTEPNVLHSSIQTQSDELCTIICAIDPPINFVKGNAKSFKVSISTNHAFEWIEHSTLGVFEPLDGDTIYDFGLRGAKVIQ